MAEDTARQVCECSHTLDRHFNAGACVECARPRKGVRMSSHERKQCMGWKPVRARLPVGERKQPQPYQGTRPSAFLYPPATWPVRVAVCYCGHLGSEHFNANDRFDAHTRLRAGRCLACSQWFLNDRDYFLEPLSRKWEDKDWPCSLFVEDKAATNALHDAAQ